MNDAINVGLLGAGTVGGRVLINLEKNAEDISVVMLLVLITGLSLWVWYGILQNELPIILSNSFSVLVNITLLICCMMYKKKS